MMIENPRVAIIILNWNGWQDTVECLESIYQMKYKEFDVVVVDNGSTDGSVEKIKEWAKGKERIESNYFSYDANNKPISYIEIEPEKAMLTKRGDPRLTIIKLKENIGFACGNNVGIRHVLTELMSDYVLILNNDVVVKSDFIFPMIKVFKEEKNVGLIGPKVLDYYSGVHWQGPMHKRINMLSTLMFFTPLKKLFVKTPIVNSYLLNGKIPIKVYEIIGCSMLFKKEALEKIGLFDESTFLGWEEFIIAEKLLKNGFNTYAVPDSIIYHKVARDTVKIEPIDKTLIFLKSERYFQTKYLKMPHIQRVIIKTIRLLAYSMISLFMSSYRKNYVKLIKAILEIN